MHSHMIAEKNDSNTSEVPPVQNNVSEYTWTFIPLFTKTGDMRIALRQYNYNSEPYFVAVDPYTFVTECAPVANYAHRRSVEGKPGYYTREEIESTPYRSALKQFTAPPYILQNYGLTKATEEVQGAFLTVDMCPSVKPFEADFFAALAAYSPPTPVAICMTGLWMLGHESEFDWLADQQKNGKLAITWVNHSFSHIYYADLTSEDDLAENFLLSKPTNLKHEIFATEQLLIKKGQTPSVFFRAPGLVTDKKIVKNLNKFGLIPVGSNAWLAKGEEPTNGSIILVHGNANEHSGIEKAMVLLDQKKFAFFPLKDAAKQTKPLPDEDLTKSFVMLASP